MTSKVLGILRESAVANYFGASWQSDAFKIAYDIPTVLLIIIVSAVATTFIPVYTEIRKTKGITEIRYFENNVFSIVFVLSGMVTLLGISISPMIVKIITPSLNPQSFALSVSLTRIFMLGLVFYALAYMANAYLQVHDKYSITAFMWLPYNIAVFISIVVFAKFGIKIVAFAVMSSMALLFLVQIPSMHKTSFRYSFLLDFKEEGFKRICCLSIPVIFSNSVNQISFFCVRMFASGLDEGTISAIDYANKVNNIILNVFFISIVAVTYPKLSSLTYNMVGFKKIVKKSITLIVLISAGATLVILLLNRQIIQLLFGRGEFTLEDTLMTCTALSGYAVGIVGCGLREFLTRCFYALGDTKITFINSMMTFIINFVLNFVFFKFWKIWGLTFSTSIALLLSSLHLLLTLKNKIATIEKLHSTTKETGASNTDVL